MRHTAFALLLSLMVAPNMWSRPSPSKLSADSAEQYSTWSSPLPVRDEREVLIRDGWVQEGPPSQTITAAYMTIQNHSGADISLKSASTEAAQTIELHKMELVAGMMKMHRVETIDIPAGGTVELKPGGYHLMVIGLKKELKEGDKVTITLEFSGDLRRTITIPVKPRSAMVKEG
jgi:hypothetical protein